MAVKWYARIISTSKVAEEEIITTGEWYLMTKIVRLDHFEVVSCMIKTNSLFFPTFKVVKDVDFDLLWS